MAESSKISKRGLAELRQLAAPESFFPEPGYRGGQFQLSYSAPSLLSSFAAWAWVDLIDPAKVYFCKHCRKLHASPKSKSRFCCASCRTMHSRKKSLAKQKAKKLREKGLSLVEISREIGWELDEVKEWLGEGTE